MLTASGVHVISHYADQINRTNGNHRCTMRAWKIYAIIDVFLTNTNFVKILGLCIPSFNSSEIHVLVASMPYFNFYCFTRYKYFL